MRPNPEADSPQRPTRSLGSLMSSATSQFTSILKAEAELAKLKMKQAQKSLAGGAVLVALAALFGLALFWWLFHSIELAFALIVPAWAAALITAGILLLLLVICLVIAVLLFKDGQRKMPEVKEGVTKDFDILKEGLSDE